eukprot:TRINITY_DN3264_c0_g2_i1.p1 TRINITY_DN3264_c0_g2~~TRINITY_DN3264_c0_g2_i1.p1  ORF type:complete len:247 (-),score=45.56 TRINITY_DN3264_c0_g2_i1:74-814(-)
MEFTWRLLSMLFVLVVNANDRPDGGGAKFPESGAVAAGFEGNVTYYVVYENVLCCEFTVPPEDRKFFDGRMKAGTCSSQGYAVLVKTEDSDWFGVPIRSKIFSKANRVATKTAVEDMVGQLANVFARPEEVQSALRETGAVAAGFEGNVTYFVVYENGLCCEFTVPPEDRKFFDGRLKAGTCSSQGYAVLVKTVDSDWFGVPIRSKIFSKANRVATKTAVENTVAQLAHAFARPEKVQSTVREMFV